MNFTLRDNLSSSDLLPVLPTGGYRWMASSRQYTEIWLIRHGQTPWNVEKRLQGQLDTELDDVGIQQAKAVAHWVHCSHHQNHPFDRLVTSDLARAKKTADEITSLCPDLPIHLDPRLREMHMGQFQGLTVGEIFQDSPLAQKYTAFIQDKKICAPEGGER